jgi:uncharacterized repeat protein (TIGR03803 family)
MNSRLSRPSCRFTALVFAAIATFGITAAAQETILVNFNGSDGSSPNAALISDPKGNLYGTALGGSGGLGVVFELSHGQGGWTESVLYNFGSVGGDGASPLANLVFDAKGNLYGTTRNGGAHNDGIVFELSPGSGGVWTEKILYSFGAIANDGTNPGGCTLIFDSKGNLYGTTNTGGSNGASPGDGTVFELSPQAGGGWSEKVLYNFGASNVDGINPAAGLTFDAFGNLYGTTFAGGASGYGSVFELSRAKGGGWTESVLHSFDINHTDGARPMAGVVFDAQGNLYGTTMNGGAFGNGNGLGTVYELSPSAEGLWIEQVVHSFTGGGTNGDGDYPVSSLILDTAGNLYGMTSGGGVYAYGIVFELTRAGTNWAELVVHTFAGPSSDGAYPMGSLLFDAAGDLYGTTSYGGTTFVDGTVFQIANVVTASPTFSPHSGAYKTAQKVKITDATAGATIYYTINGSGPSIKYARPISVSKSEILSAWAVSATLPQSQVSLADYQIGSVAAAPVFVPPAGTYTTPQSVTLLDAAPHAVIHYTTNGTTPTPSSPTYKGPIKVSTTKTIKAIAVAKGFTNSPVASAKYTIKKIVPPKETVLYSFGATSTDAQVPLANLVSDSKGNFYGTTKYGGTNQITYGGTKTTAGTAFELSPAGGGGWTETVLYDFYATTTDAALPIAGLIFDAKGNLYGTSFAGGAYGLGSVFELLPKGGGGWTETVLYSFGVSVTDAAIPEAPLIMDAHGNLYGTTEVGGAYATSYGGGYGTVFELSPASGGGWTEQILHSFDNLNQTDGYFPAAGLVFDGNGNLYGTTQDGGSGQDLEGGGTVFELSPAGKGWTEKILYSFGGGSTNGYDIVGGVVLDSAGNIYGTAVAGGNGFGLDGTVFELSPQGGGWTETVLHSFGAFEGDGINPDAGLTFDAQKVNLYGTTFGGGANNAGTVFELTPQSGGGWIENVLHSFALNGTDGANPYANLILDSTGNLYGTTAYGGAHGGSNTGGIVFEIAK